MDQNEILKEFEKSSVNKIKLAVTDMDGILKQLMRKTLPIKFGHDHRRRKNIQHQATQV